uniref:U66-Liphistoxin-Lth1a_1 n=1 Tax=Liphistius thaleban TaxID=1905330 RepID=A0A4Q8K5K9_9ARAC
MQLQLVITCFTALVVTVASQMTGESTYACSEGCYPDVCQTVKCGLREGECTNGTVREGAGICGCCNNCIETLCEGECCDPLPGYGVPTPVKYCDYGLTCDCERKVCVPCPTCVPQG